FILLMFQNTLFAQYRIDSLRIFVMFNDGPEVIKKYNHFEQKVQYEIPCISPIETNQNHFVTSFFGNRVHPVSGKSHFHSAIDISAKEHEPVFATADGIIIESRYDTYLGNYIIIEHPNGYQTLYGHLSISEVEVGEMMVIGQKIGLIGKTGRATGPHLHYGVKKNGQFVNPLPYINLLGNYILNH
ncbi:M23 family metallopeptidase, partial [Emticicia oligotrophica]